MFLGTGNHFSLDLFEFIFPLYIILTKLTPLGNRIWMCFLCVTWKSTVLLFLLLLYMYVYIVCVPNNGYVFFWKKNFHYSESADLEIKVVTTFVFTQPLRIQYILQTTFLIGWPTAYKRYSVFCVSFLMIFSCESY